MFTHWPIVTFVTETLAKSAAGLDKSGFDLKFTIDGHKHDAQRLKGDPGRKKLKKAFKRIMVFLKREAFRMGLRPLNVCKVMWTM